MAFSDAKQCDATAKSTGKQCSNPAVSGSSKCRIHGGKTPSGEALPQFKHGRYSKYAPQTMQSKMDELSDYPLLDLADELQAQRALLSQHMSRHPDGVPMSEHTIHMMMTWLNTIGVMVERITKIRNETALTGAEIALLKTRAVELVMKYIDNPDDRIEFVKELFQISEPAKLE